MRHHGSSAPPVARCARGKWTIRRHLRDFTHERTLGAPRVYPCHFHRGGLHCMQSYYTVPQQQEYRMPAIAHSLRVPEPLENEIKRELSRRGVREWSAGVLQLIDEAVRVSRAPGIVFVDAWDGRRAALAFSGLEVWEIIAFWKERGENWEVFRKEFEELSEQQ